MILKTRTLLTCLIILIGIDASAQTLSGYVKDSATGEALIGAIIKTSDSKKGTATDTKGFYKLALPNGKYTLVTSHLGHLSIEKNVVVANQNITLNFNLSSTIVTTQEAVVTGKRTNVNVTSTEMSRVELTGEQVKTLPVIFGEPSH